MPRGNSVLSVNSDSGRDNRRLFYEGQRIFSESVPYEALSIYNCKAAASSDLENLHYFGAWWTQFILQDGEERKERL